MMASNSGDSKTMREKTIRVAKTKSEKKNVARQRPSLRWQPDELANEPLKKPSKFVKSETFFQIQYDSQGEERCSSITPRTRSESAQAKKARRTTVKQCRETELKAKSRLWFALLLGLFALCLTILWGFLFKTLVVDSKSRDESF